MVKIKTLLISKISKINKNEVYNFSKLSYTKIILLYLWDKEIDTRIPSKVTIIKCLNLIELNKQISETYNNYMDYKIIPFFSWDANSKYSIKVYNKTFWTNINPRIFKEKDVMGEFLGDISKKKFIKFTYKELISTKYEELINRVWNEFIVKPTNASSSTNTFKINTSKTFDRIKTKLSKKYEYILEEYIWWELFSIDFFFDWEKMFLLVLAREIAMIELSDKDKFSKTFIDKYWEELSKHFNFILPLGYHLDINKLSKVELIFLEDIKNKLKKIWYRWVVHLEYKYDKKAWKLGFVEWWARYGWYRKLFMKKIYNTDHLRLQYNILIEKDFSKFTKVKWDIYKFKEKEHNLNFVRVKTNFIEKTNYIQILDKSWDVFKKSFDWFLNDYYKNKFWIYIKKIDFFVKYNKEYNFLPFYKNSETKLDYVLELDDENFKLFKKKKFKIIEEIFFHDYNSKI